MKPSGSPTNSNIKNTNDLTIIEIGNSQVNLISSNNVPCSPSLFGMDNCEATLKNEYEAMDSKTNNKEASITKDEDQKSIEIEIDVRTPLLGSNNTSGSEK